MKLSFRTISDYIALCLTDKNYLTAEELANLDGLIQEYYRERAEEKRISDEIYDSLNIVDDHIPLRTQIENLLPAGLRPEQRVTIILLLLTKLHIRHGYDLALLILCAVSLLPGRFPRKKFEMFLAPLPPPPALAR